MPCPRAASTSALEVRQRAQLRVDRGVAALGGRRSPRGCRARRGAATGELLRPLRWVRADRVDRRQVDHVEAQLARAAGAAARTPAKPPNERGKSSYQAPTRARSRSTSTSKDSERARSRRSGSREQGLGHRRARAPRRRGRRRPSPAAQGRGGRSATRRSGALQAPGRVLEQRRALGELALEVLLAGGQLALDLVAPRRERGPPTPRPGSGGRPSALVVNSPRQRSGVSCSIGSSAKPRAPGRPVPHDGPQRLVAVAHEVALHHHGVADGALGGPAAALDDRPDVVDLDPRRGRAGRRCGHGRHSA